MRKSIVIIGIIILIVGGFFTVLRGLRPSGSAIQNEELQQRLEERIGLGGISGYLNWILLVIGGIVTAVGFYLSPKHESNGFKMGY